MPPRVRGPLGAAAQIQKSPSRRTKLTSQNDSFEGHRPQVSFALPVRDGDRTIERALESLRTQDFDDFEVVVSDNASSDRTEEIARDFAARDPRFRYHRNDRDIGQIENFNCLVGLTRGSNLRWLGVDDYLEPTYASRCIAALDADPEAIGVTTLWRLIDDDGNVNYREYTGPRADSSDVNSRLNRTLWFLQAHRLYFDPIYSMLRRSALEQTQLLLIDPWTDRLLAIELCLAGPFCHVHECLSTRRDAGEPASVRLKRYHAKYEGDEKPSSAYRLAPVWTMYAAIAKVVQAWPLTASQRLRGLATVFRYWIRAELRRPMAYVTGFVRRRLSR